MVRYYCDPQEDCTLEEAHLMSAVEPMPEFWQEEDIPEGCERHFVAIASERVAEILKERANANKRPAR